jgi:hypothetical protein
MGDKRLNQVPTGAFESLRATEICGVLLNKGWIELVLPDKETQSVPQPRLTVVGAIRRVGLHRWFVVPCRTRKPGKRSQFLDRTEADPVSFPQGSVDGSCLGDAHFSPVNHQGNIGGIGVAIANETSRGLAFIYSGLKNPSVEF